MFAIGWLLHNLEAHKDAFVAIAALLSPFAAVALGVYTSTKQLAAASLNIERQLGATVGIAYRQKLIDNLRNNIAAQLGLTVRLRIERQRAALDPQFEVEATEAFLHLTRIQLLVDQSNLTKLETLALAFNAMTDFIKSLPQGQLWTEKEGTHFDRLARLVLIAALALIRAEQQLAALEPTAGT
ncbi:MAG: hypothetical protein WAO00_10510 [Chthoniobacterales bacterium]